ncbi:MAG: hypothetical protein QOJ44_2044, partial [Acidimicrobiaceae bacterium]|nr:hypothetical protein [Acidimicrobiaceae bacterium]
MSTAVDSKVSGTAPDPGSDQLLAIADRVAGWAGTGEDVEVYVARGHET